MKKLLIAAALVLSTCGVSQPAYSEVVQTPPEYSITCIAPAGGTSFNSYIRYYKIINDTIYIYEKRKDIFSHNPKYILTNQICNITRLDEKVKTRR